MNSTLLADLFDQLEKELYRLHYTDQSVVQYRRMWKRIAAFFSDKGADHFTEEMGLLFLEEKYNFFELEKAGKLTQSIINVFRVVRMLGDFQQHGCILRRYYKQKQLLQYNEAKEVLQRYARYCQQKEYSKVTQHHYCKITEKFLSFLESQETSLVSEINSMQVSGYINTLIGYSSKTVELELCGLRSFLRFLNAHDLHPLDLAESIPSIIVHKHSRIPSVWSQENVIKLLDVIDRGNPAGKRDYAIILLVTRLGLRSIDVKHLRLSNLIWQDNRIELEQSKTAKVLNLPLLPDVGWAIIDYLKNGRPKIDSPYVFLRHLAPLEPFSDEDHLHQIIIKYMRLARIPISPKKRKGMHSLRHTLASRLLAENTPLPVISDILGHISADSTAVYLKVDLNKLRECALNPEGVFES